MKFIDLFVEQGGFSQALSQGGRERVLASALNTYLSGLYEKNFELRPASE